MDFERILSRNVFCILGLPFDAVSMADAAATITSAATSGKRLFLSTPNLNWTRVAAEDPGFRDATILSDLSIADGMPIVWVSRALSIPIRQRTSGSDLMNTLAQNALLKVFFFGGLHDAADTAASKLNEKNIPMTAVGALNPGHGTFEEMSSVEIIDNINGKSPDFVVVSLGAVKGQKWIFSNRSKLNAPVISHLGAVVNFYAGTVRRAPAIMQRLGAEWLWRILQEPSLAARYVDDGRFFIRQLLTRVIPYKLYLIRSRNLPAQQPGRVSTIIIWNLYTIYLSGTFCELNIEVIKAVFIKAIQSGFDIKLDISRCVYVDAMSIGSILLLKKCCLESGRQLQVLGATRTVRDVFYYCHAEYLLAGSLPTQAPEPSREVAPQACA